MTLTMQLNPHAAPHGGAERALSAAQIPYTRAERAMTLLTLSHTPVEHQLYLAMLTEVVLTGVTTRNFSIRGLMLRTRVRSYSTIRRGLAGLVNKLSIEPAPAAGEAADAQQGARYCVFTPAEIFTRRTTAGRAPYPKEFQPYGGDDAFCAAIGRVAAHHELSRREAQVALCCTEGLTNAEIGARLFISEQTVKFHLRQIFVKLNVKRRAELIALLLRQPHARV
jgi:DNA-binding CsgD family transcriptional regulator